MPGNPVSYGDQKYVWMGKQLTEIINADGTKTTFAYDADGFRTEKHQIGADGTEEYVVYYIWLNGVLTQQYLLYSIEMTIQGETRRVQLPFFIEFIYDDSNQAQGCILNGDAGYLFVRNLQGDVIALADMEGRVMIEYNYDPWGKISYIYFDENGNPSNEIADESLQMITAIFCPLTYRGYNYDFTTGLYYLQSRYYNPEWGRFLNCDDTSILLATQGETHGANLYAYCGNNPVNDLDPTGKRPTFKENQSIGEWVGNLIGVIILLAPFIGDNIDNYFRFRRNCNLCEIAIDLKPFDFFTAINVCNSINSELTYQCLAVAAEHRFLEKTYRHFLFSDDCIADEIKAHFELYDTSQIYQNSIIDGVLTPTVIDFAFHNFLRKHCEVINIYEGDVYNSKQAIAFNYRDEIRSCYKNTSADPYSIGVNKRSVNPTVPKDRTDWEGWLRNYGGKIPK